MRVIRKFKLYTKINDAYRYPLRILKFKRSKWDSIKKKLLTELTEKSKRLTEKSKGLTEESKGPTEDSKGPTEDSKGLTEDSKGPTEDSKGLTEDSKELTEDSKELTEDSTLPTYDLKGLTKEFKRLIELTELTEFSILSMEDSKRLTELTEALKRLTEDSTLSTEDSKRLTSLTDDSKLLKTKDKHLKLAYSDNDIVKLDYRLWPNIKNAYYDRVVNQRSLLIQYNNDKRILKYLKTSRKVFVSDLVKKFFRLYYRLDSLLFLANLAPSTFFSKNALKGKKILLNGQVTKRNPFLKKGDFVLIRDKSFKYKVLSTKYTEANLYPTFIEVDYYTQSLVLLKALDETTPEDFSISIGSHLDLTSS